MQSHFITMAPHAWGKADTPEQALKNCRKIYGPGMKDYDTYAVHPETRVDGMGYFCYPQGETPQANAPKLLQRVRKGKIQKLDE